MGWPIGKYSRPMSRLEKFIDDAVVLGAIILLWYWPLIVMYIFSKGAKQ